MRFHRHRRTAGRIAVMILLSIMTARLAAGVAWGEGQDWQDRRDERHEGHVDRDRHERHQGWRDRREERDPEYLEHERHVREWQDHRERSYGDDRRIVYREPPPLPPAPSIYFPYRLQ